MTDIFRTRDMAQAQEQEKVAKLDEVAKVYDESDFDRRMRFWMWCTLKQYIKPSYESALEVGCYRGWFTYWLHGTPWQHITVAEPCQEFIDITKKSFIPGVVKFEKTLFENYDPDGRFDAIFMVHTLEHFDDPVAMLSRAKGMLKIGGQIYIVVPNAEAVSRRLAVKMGRLPSLTDQSEADIKHGHRRVYSLDTLQKDCRSAGLKPRHTGGIFFKALANFQIDGIRTDTEDKYLSPEYMEACYQLGFEYPSMCASIYAVCEVA